jgi:acetyltransferase-like isoleucine patch superfamily enzyme
MLARDVRHGKDPDRREGQAGEISSHEASAEVVGSRQTVDARIANACWLLAEPRHALDARRYDEPVVASDVADDLCGIATHDRVGRHGIGDHRAGFDHRSAGDDNTGLNDCILTDHRAAPESRTGEDLRSAADRAVVTDDAIGCDEREGVNARAGPDLGGFTNGLRMDVVRRAHRTSDVFGLLTESVAMRGTVHETSWVSPKANVGAGVTIGPMSVVHDGVTLGDGSFVGSHVVLGEPTNDFYHSPSYEPQPCLVGRSAVIRSHSVVYAGAMIGDNFSCGHHVTIREGTQVGVHVQIGTQSDIQGRLQIGDYTRIHSGVFIAQDTVIDEFVWVFPHAVLTNDPHPPSDSCTKGPTLRRFAVVGAHATIMPAVEIGTGALVGAAALVRHDVSPGEVVVGVPARVVGTTADITCHDGRLGQVYPWWRHFRRGYPEGVLPDIDVGDD